MIQTPKTFAGTELALNMDAVRRDAEAIRLENAELDRPPAQAETESEQLARRAREDRELYKDIELNKDIERRESGETGPRIRVYSHAERIAALSGVLDMPPIQSPVRPRTYQDSESLHPFTDAVRRVAQERGFEVIECDVAVAAIDDYRGLPVPSSVDWKDTIRDFLSASQAEPVSQAEFEERVDAIASDLIARKVQP